MSVGLGFSTSVSIEREQAAQESSIRFQALKNFWCEELKSAYETGMYYTARPGNYTLLHFLTKWIEEGKVKMGGPAAKVTGKG